MLLACPRCQRGIEGWALDPLAGTGRCADCGDVRPDLRTPVAGVATLRLSPTEWQGDWTSGPPGLRFEATYRPAWGRMFKPVAFVSAAIVIFMVLSGRFDLGLLVRLLGWQALMFVVAELLARFQTCRIAMDRDRFAWRRLLLRRSAPVDDVVRFHAQKTPDGEGGSVNVLIADLAPSAQITLWSSESEALVTHLCGYLNEALFVVTAKVGPRGPYR